MDPGRVDKDKLRFRQGEDTQLLASCGLRLWGNCSDRLAEEGVDQCGLSDIWPSSDGDKTRSMIFRSWG